MSIQKVHNRWANLSNNEIEKGRSNSDGLKVKQTRLDFQFSIGFTSIWFTWTGHWTFRDVTCLCTYSEFYEKKSVVFFDQMTGIVKHSLNIFLFLFLVSFTERVSFTHQPNSTPATSSKLATHSRSSNQHNKAVCVSVLHSSSVWVLCERSCQTNSIFFPSSQKYSIYILA